MVKFNSVDSHRRVLFLGAIVMCRQFLKSLVITHARFSVTLMLALSAATPRPVSAQSSASAPASTPAKSSRWVLPLHGSWQQQSLRQMLNRISEIEGVGILLDRRVDPDQELNHSATGKALDEEIIRLADAVHQQTQRIGETAYLGPRSAASLIRAVIALRTEEIAKSPDPHQRKQWLDPFPFAWAELETPRQILSSLIEPLGISCRHEELIPHDQWSAANLRGLNRVEILSLVLIQWDLTFEPNFKNKEITLVKIPSRIELKREYALTREQVASVKGWQEQLPHLQLQLKGSKVLAIGLLEDHDKLSRLLQPVSSKPMKTAIEATPIERRRFTLQVKNVTVRQLMQELQKSGIEFVYDSKRLEAQGISFDQDLALDVEGLAPQEFFDKIFKPLRLRARISGLKVELTPQ